MPNFHCNSLAIVADEENMRKVLMHFAINLAANSDRTEFYLDEIDPEGTIEKLYGRLSEPISYYYIDALTTEQAEFKMPAAMLPYLAAFGQSKEIGDGISVSFSGVASSARPLSDMAEISMRRYGEKLGLWLNYDTAWESNTEDIDHFFEGLAEGNYGVSFFDADEGTGYEDIHVLSGIHHGQAELDSLDSPYTDDYCYSGELQEERKRLSTLKLASLDDLAEIARVINLREWPEYGFNDDFDDGDYDDEDNFNEDGERFEDSSFFENSSYDDIDWEDCDERSLRRIDKVIYLLMENFPLVLPISGSAYDGREAVVDKLIAGDSLKLVSDWESEYFDNCGIDVQTATGKSLGNLEVQQITEWGGRYETFFSCDVRPALACILPFVTAHAETVQPLHALSARCQHSRVQIKIDLVGDDFSTAIEDAHELLTKPPKKRKTTSVVNGGR